MRLSLVLAVFVFGFSCSSNSQSAEALSAAEDTAGQEGYPFPVYTDFEQLKPWLNRTNDTTYVVNFWATWCKPCVKELPYFERLEKEKRASKAKTRVLLVSLDFGKELDSKLLPFVEKRRLQAQVIALLDDDYNKWIDQVSPEWSGAIPATLIYRGAQKQFFPDAFDSYEDLQTALTGFAEN